MLTEPLLTPRVLLNSYLVPSSSGAPFKAKQVDVEATGTDRMFSCSLSPLKLALRDAFKQW